jgi:hypothetical protein
VAEQLVQGIRVDFLLCLVTKMFTWHKARHWRINWVRMDESGNDDATFDDNFETGILFKIKS